MLDDARAQIFARGYQEFMGLTLQVSPGVLIPREETELLGRTACGLLNQSEPVLVVDMCTGSGNLACAIAKHVPGARVWAADASPECVQLAQANVAALGLEGRVEVLASDLFQALRGWGLEGTLDLIVCNPPYISSGRLNSASSWLVEEEPRLAFDGGPYGLDVMTRVIREAPEFLKPDGVLAFEFGAGQHPLVKRMVDSTKQYEAVRFVCDAQDVPRVAVASRKTEKAANASV